MSNKKRVCVAITARPSYSRIRAALAALDAHDAVELSILCSGSALLDRYGRVVDLIRADGFNVVDELYTFVEGDELLNMALTTASTINHSAMVLRREAPDLVVTIADRYETLGTAVAAAYLGLPLAHVQGGEITGNIDEKVRHAVTKLADLHLVSTALAGERVRRMGETAASIHVTGCPSVDLARESIAIPAEEIQRVVDRYGVGDHVDVEQDFVVILQHPETDAHEAAFDQMTAILHVVKDIGLPIILFWPNVDAGSDGTSKAIRVFREQGHGEHMRFIKNLEGKQFLALLQRARCLIGNSSVGIREFRLSRHSGRQYRPSPDRARALRQCARRGLDGRVDPRRRPPPGRGRPLPVEHALWRWPRRRAHRRADRDARSRSTEAFR